MAAISALRHGQGMGRVRVAIWLGALGLFLLPAIAMHFTRDVRWTASDFAIFAVMLAIVCAGFEGLWRRTDRTAYLLGGIAVLGTAFLLVWADLAVGIFR